ncbi:FIST signal transduction protein [Thiolinea disciformis]|uniref:FIST signal transduction protein n=1 Tax=Thiolinea disciformis TaxID=125614 RepID=UPI000370A1F0|nr:FIST N-terminal domain-containing protein [Thiolinea disciformis]
METLVSCYTHSTGWQPALPSALDSEQTLVLVFGPAEWNDYQNAFFDIKQHFPKAIVAGCSGNGQILHHALHDQALVVSITRFEKTQLRLAQSSFDNRQESWRMGYRLASDLDEKDLSAIFVLSDGWSTNGTDLTNGLYAALGRTIPIAGGLSGGFPTHASTWVIKQGIPHEKAACAIGFYGKQIGFLSQARHGARPFGPQRTITYAHNNKLFEMDGTSALDIYEEYLAEQAKIFEHECVKFPLLMQEQDSTEPVIRTPLAVDRQTKTIIFAGDLSNNSTVQLMYGGVDNLLDGAEEAAIRLAARLPNPTPKTLLLLAVSCGARRVILAEDTEAELTNTIEAFPPNTSQVGFYSHGEISPRSETGVSALHNQTMTLTVLYEQ